MRTAWPTAGELATYLVQLGYTGGVDDAQLALDAAVDELHRVIGYSPFLKEAATAHLFDPPRTRVLILGAPFATVSSVDVSGVTMTAGTQYWLQPAAGPYTRIEFDSSQFGDPQTITVTGARGYSETIPADLWMAVRDYAAGVLLGQSAIAGGAYGASRIKQGQVEIETGKEGAAHSALKTEALKVFARYTAPQAVGARP